MGGQTLAHNACLMLAILMLTAMFPHRAEGYTFNYPPLSASTYSYRINAASFVLYAPVPELTQQDQYIYWLHHAAAVWPGEGGVAVNLNYLGTTNAFCQQHDGINTIAATSACLDHPDCKAIGQARWTTSPPYGPDRDFCITTHRGDFFIDPATRTNRWDFVGTAAHEFGHILGLDHTANTLMKPEFSRGEVESYLRPDDIQGAMKLYGPRYRVPFWVDKPYLQDTFNTTRRYVGDGTPFGVDATIGHAAPAGQWLPRVAMTRTRLVYTQNEWRPTDIIFSRADFPLSSTSTWQSLFVSSTNAWGRTALAANSNVQEDGRWLGARREFSSMTNSNGVQIYLSLDGFATSTNAAFISAPDPPFDPALTFDPSSNFFILAISYTTGIEFLTSATGLTPWQYQATFVTNTLRGGARLACDNSGDCFVSYRTWNPSTGQARISYQRFTVSSQGVVQLQGSPSINSSALPWPAPMAFNAWEGDWFQSRSFPATSLQAIHGAGNLRHRMTSSTPPNGWSSWFHDDSFQLDHQHSLVADPEGFPPIYLFSTDDPDL